MMRSSVCRLLAASLALICPTLSGHAEYPDRSLKIIVEYAVSECRRL
jgi:hypothetical protein